MRLAFALFVPWVAAVAGFAPQAAANSPSSADARWADLQAQARMGDGDYDGAVQAEHQADIDRREAGEPERRPAAP